MQTGRTQPAITIRSQRLLEQFMVLTRDGRSQVQVIEQRSANIAEPPATHDDRSLHIAKIQGHFALEKRISMGEFDAREFDDNGDLR